MAAWIVTIKITPRPDRNIASKQTGKCPVSGDDCTDKTGAHHSMLWEADTADEARQEAHDIGLHVTRVEGVSSALVTFSPAQLLES